MLSVIGIDPGANGAFWELSSVGVTGRWIDMPFHKSGISESEIVDFMKNFSPKDTLVALEQPFYSPLMRGQAGYKFGIYYGIVKGIIYGMGFSVEDVRPVIWKRYFGLISTKDNPVTKENSINRAILLNKNFKTKFTYKRILTKRKGVMSGCEYTQQVSKDGRAEAFLIAEYARRNLLNKPESKIS